MTKTWKIAIHEYLKHVRNKRFIMGLMSMPLVVVAMIGLIVLIVSMEMKDGPIGYVDHSGILTDPLPGPEVEPPEKPVEIHVYADEDAAGAAMDAGQIHGYYVVPQDYLQSGTLTLVYTSEVKEVASQQFYRLLSANLLRDVDAKTAERLLEGAEITVATPDGSRNLSGNNWFSTVLPFIAGIIFIIAMFSSGGYLMQAVVDEKENRTIEVLLTSVSPNQFMAGKILGDTAVGMTQILAWGAFLAIGLLVGSRYTDILQGLHVSWRSVFIYTLILFPTFITIAALMAAVGATVTEAREGQQVTGWFGLPIWIPYIFAVMLIETPNAPFSVVLSLLPLTAPLAMLIRDGVTVVPVWQLAVASGVQVLGAGFAIWLAGKAFRLGMLLTGKRLKWRELFARGKHP